MRKLVIVNGPNNNFYGIRNKGQYGNQLYADLIEELKAYGASIGFEVEAFQNNGEGAIIDYFQSLYFEADGAESRGVYALQLCDKGCTGIRPYDGTGN